MSPPADHEEPGASPSAGDDKEPPGDGPRGEPQSVGILFIAAAMGLALLLGVIGMLAFAAMSRMPPPVDPPATALLAPPFRVSCAG
jgi:hypothetical protein